MALSLTSTNSREYPFLVMGDAESKLNEAAPPIKPAGAGVATIFVSLRFKIFTLKK